MTVSFIPFTLFKELLPMPIVIISFHPHSLMKRLDPAKANGSFNTTHLKPETEARSLGTSSVLLTP